MIIYRIRDKNTGNFYSNRDRSIWKRKQYADRALKKIRNHWYLKKYYKDADFEVVAYELVEVKYEN